MELDLKLSNPRFHQPLRDQVLVRGLSMGVDTPEGEWEMAGAVRTEGGLIVAKDLSEHVSAELGEARRVSCFYLVLAVGPKVEEKAGYPVAIGDVLLLDDHYRHSTEVIGGAGYEVMSIEAFVDKVGHVENVLDDAVGGN
ncbi:MAG: hypothetical protein GY842_13075 [bacterium]|nr:hypothetical protein [bacterium]